MRFVALLGTLLAALNAFAETPAGTLWTELKAKREKLPSLHQEFEVTQISKTVNGSRSVKRKTLIDISQGHWRERSITGSGEYVTIFAGHDLFRMEADGDEYVRTKPRSKEEDLEPSSYSEPDGSQAVEVERRPCGLAGTDHACVVLEVPLRPWMRAGTGAHITKLVDGSARVSLDTETGLLISSQMVQMIDTGRSRYQSITTYVLKRMSYGVPADANLFKLPSGNMREVKELSRWNAAKIKKQLAGKAAPELSVTDLNGKPLTLSAFQGKTVLLDFWTTWCPPCRADGSALEKLYKKYGDKDLMIVGISVSEDRAIVEKFLNQYPHSFPIVLTSENELPRPYQISVFPTYIVIDRSGELTAAVEGDKGYGDLRKLLKKAGLESE